MVMTEYVTSLAEGLLQYVSYVLTCQRIPELDAV